ncbi:unnamed protein product, partial [Closterium sp. Yama58-4]
SSTRLSTSPISPLSCHLQARNAFIAFWTATALTRGNHHFSSISSCVHTPSFLRVTASLHLPSPPPISCQAWNAFIAFWTATALTGGAPLLFTAFSIPFWLVGGE